MNEICYHGNQTIRRSEILQKHLKLDIFKSYYILIAIVNMNHAYSD